MSVPDVESDWATWLAVLLYDPNWEKGFNPVVQILLESEVPAGRRLEVLARASKLDRSSKVDFVVADLVLPEIISDSDEEGRIEAERLIAQVPEWDAQTYT